MKPYEIEAQIKDLQSGLERSIRKEVKEKLADIEGRNDDDAETKTEQIQYLLDTLRSNNATWSGGAASVTNMLETMRSNIATDMLHTINRGLL